MTVSLYDGGLFKTQFRYETNQIAKECGSDYRFDKCVVEMPSGTLRVNHSVKFGPFEEINCSLAFRWTRKVNTLSVCDRCFEEEARKINSLSIHVDFLPALEVLKAIPGKYAHDFFLVPKECKLCGDNDQWRKSRCIAEMAYIVNEMAKKHRKCYKIIKYFLS